MVLTTEHMTLESAKAHKARVEGLYDDVRIELVNDFGLIWKLICVSWRVS